MPITTNGFSARRYSEIVAEISTNLRTNISTDLDTSPESLMGIITSIFAYAIAEQEALAQAVADNSSVDKASGKFLDDLVGLTGLIRNSATFTTGSIQVTGEEGAVIANGTQITDSLGNVFVTTQDNVITQQNCTKITLALASDVNDSVSSGDSIDFVINNVAINFPATVNNDGVTYSFKLHELNNLLATVGDSITRATDSSDLNDPDSPITYIQISKATNASNIITAIPAGLVASNIGRDISVEAIIPGPIAVTAGSITSVAGADTAINESNFVTGSLEETDSELRERHQLSFSLTGNTTKSAILAKLRQVVGVTSASMFENPEPEPNVELALPPNSYECIVVGGSNEDVAQVIFDTKPAGIQTVGRIAVNVDFEGESYTVKFSRPTESYIFLEVTYDIYDEETFPANGEQGIKDAIVSYANSLQPGEDFIPKRVYGSVYSQVPGISSLTVTAVAADAPFPTPTSGFSEDRIPIASTKFVSVADSQIEVTVIT